MFLFFHVPLSLCIAIHRVVHQNDLMNARCTQSLFVLDCGLELPFSIREGPRDGRVQPHLVLSQRFLTLFSQPVNQVADQGLLQRITCTLIAL
jgi:hypothetical protein